MPTDPLQRYAPMVNIQQYYVEEYAHLATQRHDGRAQVSWSSRVTDIRKLDDGVEVTIQREEGGHSVVRADWVVACDGGRSTVRELLGLALVGTQYEGRYVIVDIEQESRRLVERLYVVRSALEPGLDPADAPPARQRAAHRSTRSATTRTRPRPSSRGNVLPRVQSHLDMIGETAPWKPLWISIYNAKCLTLGSYRHGRAVRRRRRPPGAYLRRARPELRPGRRRQPGLEAGLGAAALRLRQPCWTPTAASASTPRARTSPTAPRALNSWPRPTTAFACCATPRCALRWSTRACAG